MKKRVFVGIIIIFLLSLIPFNTTFLPEMTIRVVDENGRPYVGELASQYCTNYTMGIHPCEDVEDASKPTDVNGYVTFPARKLRASLLYRLVRPVAGLLLWVANGEYGTNASIVAGNATSTRHVDFRPEGPYPAEIIVPSKEATTEK